MQYFDTSNKAQCLMGFRAILQFYQLVMNESFSFGLELHGTPLSFPLNIIALMRVHVRLDTCNFITKPRFQSRNLYILPRTKSQCSKHEKNFHVNVPVDENNSVQTRRGGEFWASDVIMHKAHFDHLYFVFTLFNFVYLLFISVCLV